MGSFFLEPGLGKDVAIAHVRDEIPNEPIERADEGPRFEHFDLILELQFEVPQKRRPTKSR